MPTKVAKKKTSATLSKKAGRPPVKKQVQEPDVKLETSPEAGEQVHVTREARRPRVPMHEQDRIVVNERKGYFRRIFNDVGDRIARALKAGYSIVQDGQKVSGHRSSDPGQLGTESSIYVGTDDAGKEIRGVLMEIPNEWREDDLRAKNRVLKKKEEDLMRSLENVKESETYGKTVIETSLARE